ncbi:MAG TPA: serine/threonine-protein kinase, partial [Kofleriaceae bacterium]|nr:serine/threonine-protein kinase [Kofleriaceae bacterium]
MKGRSDDPDRTRVAVVDPLVGQIIAKHYRIEIGIAAGGFGSIYRALDLRDDRDVALKLLHANLTQDPKVVARFQREGGTLQQLRDPHTVKAYEVGEADDGTLYIVMELLTGENLYETFKQLGPLPWRRVVAIARAVCSSLSEAHALGIVHRDLKPANIFLQEGLVDYTAPPFGGAASPGQARLGDVGDSVKVLDFGIAKIIRGESGLDSSDLTQAGHMIGTFDYMPPEQMVGGECTGQSDLFTLGIVMYEMISGERPFGEHQSAAAMLAALLQKLPKPLGAFAEVPPELDRIVQRCIVKQPEDRYATIDDLANDLDMLLAIEDDRTRVASASSRTEQIDAITQPVSDDQMITPPQSLDDVLTPRATLEDVALDPEEAETQFTPPPVFDSRPGATTEKPKKKFIKSGTLPGIIAPKKKSETDD